MRQLNQYIHPNANEGFPHTIQSNEKDTEEIEQDDSDVLQLVNGHVSSREINDIPPENEFHNTRHILRGVLGLSGGNTKGFCASVCNSFDQS